MTQTCIDIISFQRGERPPSAVKKKEKSSVLCQDHVQSSQDLSAKCCKGSNVLEVSDPPHIQEHTGGCEGREEQHEVSLEAS